MASVYKETTKAGKIRWKIPYRDRDGVRRFIRVSRLNKKDAESFAWRVEQLDLRRPAIPLRRPI